MIDGTLAEVASKMPRGFHDTDVQSLIVEWPKNSLLMTGLAWVAEGGPSELYRPFALKVQALHALIVPERVLAIEDDGAIWRVTDLPARIDGMEGWPPGKQPVAAYPGAFTYSFFVDPWNDFIVVHAASASLTWIGAPVETAGP